MDRRNWPAKMSLASTILRRVHRGAARAVAPFAAVGSAGLEISPLAEPKLCLLEFGHYRFQRIRPCKTPLLPERPKCQWFKFELLRERGIGHFGLTFLGPK